MECPICYKGIEISAIGSCTHHFCYDCIVKWCRYGGTKCPTCKLSITHIRQDQEFDILNRKLLNIDENFIKPEKNIIKPEKNIIIINFERNDNAGITLKNYYKKFGNRGSGVIVSKINETNKCYKNGLRKNDIILSINNIPCIDHKRAISIVNQCVTSSSQMVCSLLKIIKL
jgi:hypothetical protein